MLPEQEYTAAARQSQFNDTAGNNLIPQEKA